jgi:zinc protease
MNLRLRLSKFQLAILICGLIAGGMLEGKAAEAKSKDAKSTEAASTVALPSAKEVLDRYAKAIGGKDTFNKNDSQHATGTVQMKAQGLSGKLEVWAARPNKLLMKMSMPGIGDFNTGYDGKVAWMSSALTGPMLLEGKMGAEIATQADFDHALHDPKDYTKMEMLGTEEFNGEQCYKLKLVHRTGFESTEFFSQKTGLQRGFIATQESPLGPITSTTLVTDYKKFGDLLMPSRISQKAAGVETVMTMDEMEFNKVDTAIFELPADVKALTEEPKDEEKDPGDIAVKQPKKSPEPEQKKATNK